MGDIVVYGASSAIGMRIVKRLDVEGDDSPRLLHISYAESDPQASVSRSLWTAWTCLPPDEMTTSRMIFKHSTMHLWQTTKAESFVLNARSLTNEKLADIPQNPDQSSVHTEWRDQVYFQWNHVFFDIAGWLQSQFPQSAEVGHFHPPKSSALGLEFPDGSATVGITKIWDFDILLAPAYVKPGVKLRLSDAASTATDLPAPADGIFDDWVKGDIYYVRSGTEINLTIERPEEDRNICLGAVMVAGELCLSDHADDEPPEKEAPKEKTEEEIEEEELQMELRSSMAMALGAFYAHQSGRTTESP